LQIFDYSKFGAGNFYGELDKGGQSSTVGITAELSNVVEAGRSGKVKAR
jgi:hypothetical protein